MYSVDLKNVTKRWGDVTAVDEVNLHINEGEFVVLLGPSGCGKTTTMRLVAGLEDITDGEIKIGDEIVNDVDPRKRDVSFQVQNTINSLKKFLLLLNCKIYYTVNQPNYQAVKDNVLL